MANVLTDLAADIYVAADLVGRELVGVVSSVVINGNGSDRVALNDTVRSHFTRQPSTSVSITPSMTIPQGTDQTVDNKTLTIDNAKAIQIPWTGEDMKHVNNGSGFATSYGDQIAQAMRTLSNEIEVDMATAMYQAASRATGTAGTTPFGSNFNIVAEARQILVDNGCPTDALTMVLNTSAGTKLRNLAQLQKANEAGGDTLLRQGVLLDLQNVGIKESAGIVTHTKGGGTGYLIDNGSDEPIGETTLSLDTGSGTMLIGDVIKMENDARLYVCNAAIAAGDILIGEPGLIEQADDDDTVTIQATFAANLMFHRTAGELAIRAPAVPEGGDAADDAMIVMDPWSGLTFEIRAYEGYRKSMFEVASAWGVKAWKSEHIAIVLG